MSDWITSTDEFFCFNDSCDFWGESHAKPYGILAYYGWHAAPRCAGCGEDMIWHDNWQTDNRRHDDGTKVSVG